MIKRIKNRLENIFLKVIHYDDWNVGMVEGNVNSLIDSDSLNIKWFRHQNNQSYLADPFIYNQDGKDYIFLEEFDYITNKGHISVIYDWDTPPKKIIDEPYHLSYPFLFDYNGELYMIPEASAGRQLYYYRCEKFPFEWTKLGVLLDEEILDPTIFKWNEKYFLFYTKPSNSSGPLYIQYSESPLGPWKEHSCPPVQVSNKTSRPAGPLFTIKNDLYRPSQDSSTSYGDNIIINKITELSTESFTEEKVKLISPKKHHPYLGFHHVSYTDRKLVIDGRKTIKRFKSIFELIKTITNKFRRF